LTATLLDSYSEANKDGQYELNADWNASHSALTHSFTTPNNGLSHLLSSLKLYLDLSAGSTYSLTAHIYSHTGTYGTSSEPDTLLASSDAVTSGLTGTFALTTFTFSLDQRIVLSPNTHYVLVVRRDSGDGTVRVGSDSSTPTHGGNVCTWDGAAWQVVADIDACFYVYGEEMGILIDSYSESNFATGDPIDDLHPSDTGNSAHGQALTTPATTYVLNKAVFYLKKSGSPTGNLTCQVFDSFTGTVGSTAYPNASAIAESDTVDSSSIGSADYELVTFTFSGANRITLSASTDYGFAVVAKTATIDGSNYILIGLDFSSPTHSGNGFLHQTGSWEYGAIDDIFYLFGEPTYALTITAVDHGSSDPAEGIHYYEVDESVEVTATPDSHYELDYWTLDDVEHEGSDSIIVTMDDDHTLTAVYVYIGKTLTITAVDHGSTNPAEGEHVYDQNEEAEVTAAPDEGYEFSYWRLDDDPYSTDNPVSVTMDDDHTLTVVYLKEEYTVIISASGTKGATDPVAGAETVEEDATLEVTATATASYTFNHWLYSGIIYNDNPVTVSGDVGKTYTLTPVYYHTQKLFNNAKAAFKRKFGASFEVTRKILELGDADTITGIPAITYTSTESINMIILPKGVSFAFTALGVYSQCSLTGYTDSNVAIFDIIEDSEGVEYRVLTVQSYGFSGVFFFNIVELEKMLGD